MSEAVQRYPSLLSMVWARFLAAPPGNPVQQLLAGKYLAEALVKLTCSYALAVCRTRDADTAHFLEYHLARANSLGTWSQVLDQAVNVPAWTPPEFLPLATFLLTKHGKTGDRDPRFAIAWDAFENLRDRLGEDSETYPGSPRYLFLVEFLVRFRNGCPAGHGAQTEEWARQIVEPLRDLLGALSDGLAGLPFVAAYAGEDQEGGYLLLLDSQTPGEFERPEHDVERGRLCLYAREAKQALVLPGFVLYEPEGMAVWFHNGEISRKGASEFICYADGRTKKVDIPEYVGSVPELPASVTSGSRRLMRHKGYNHNLPSVPADYIHRDELEERLVGLINNRTHRMITLHGAGGSGKTTLALAAFHYAMEDQSLNGKNILWFSARDVDLITGGPKVRKREVSDLKSIEGLFCRLMIDEELSDGEAESLFCSEVSGTDQYLVVMDNFETLDDPRGIYEFLDTHVVLPSKVLITSREREFVGDFSIPVSGMTYEEAEQLILRAARTNYCEGLFQRKADRVRVYELAKGNPYQMKLLVNLVATGSSLDSLAADLAGREDLLEALFRRSYEKLSAAGQWLYLVLGALNIALPQIAAEVVLDGRELFPRVHFSTRDATRELAKYSLLAEAESSHTGAVLSLPFVSARFAQKVALASPSKLEIEADVAELRELLRPGYAGMDPRAMMDLLKRHSGQSYYRHDELINLALRLCDRHPELWRDAANWFAQMKVDKSVVREALFRALEENASVELLTSIASIERSLGDDQAAIGYLIRAAEMQSDNLEFVSKVANDFNFTISTNKTKFPVYRRNIYSNVLIGIMEQYRTKKKLSGDDYARLAWLYLNNYAPNIPGADYFLHNALRVGLEGLGRFPPNRHLENAVARCEEAIKASS